MRIALLSLALLGCSTPVMHDVIGPDSSKDGGRIGDAMTTTPDGSHPEGGGPGLPPDIAMEACVLIPGSTTGYWSEHLYPGKTVLDLAHVTAIVHYATESPNRPGYHDYATSCAVRDGAAATSCAGPTDAITFILP